MRTNLTWRAVALSCAVAMGSFGAPALLQAQTPTAKAAPAKAANKASRTQAGMVKGSTAVHRLESRSGGRAVP